MSASKVGKAVKMISFAAQSTESHSTVKIKSLLKWLKSGHGVKIHITGKPDHHKAIESLYDQIITRVKSGAIVEGKTVKPEIIKFQLTPTEDAKDLVLNDSKSRIDVDKELEQLSQGKDMFSEEFEKDLNSWVQDAGAKNKKT